MPQQTIDRNQFVNQFQSVLLLIAMAGVLGLTGFLMLGFWGFIGALGLFGLRCFVLEESIGCRDIANVQSLADQLSTSPTVGRSI